MKNELVLNPAAGQPATMSSLEISFLVESRHDSVKRSIERLAEKGVIQHPPMVEVKNSQGQLVWVHQLEKRDTFVIVAQLSPEFTARVVDRWQELEASASKPAELSRMDILKLAMESEQARIVAEEKLALAAPKIAHFDAVVERSTLVTATQVGQKIGLSAVALNKVLDELGLYHSGVKRGRVFKQWIIDKGYGGTKANRARLHASIVHNEGRGLGH